MFGSHKAENCFKKYPELRKDRGNKRDRLKSRDRSKSRERQRYERPRYGETSREEVNRLTEREESRYREERDRERERDRDRERDRESRDRENRGGRLPTPQTEFTRRVRPKYDIFDDDSDSFERSGNQTRSLRNPSEESEKFLGRRGSPRQSERCLQTTSKI